jgi:putative MATE family efflux protein
MNRLKLYFGDRAFYKMALTVALPMMLQNLITNLVGMLDNIMVGKLGTEQVSGVSIVNQILFVYSLAIFGGLSGIGIFTAQYYGKGDQQGIRYTLRLKALIGTGIFAVGTAILLVFQEPLIDLFLHDGSYEGDLELTMAYAKDYLFVMLFGLIFFAFTQVFADTMRQTGDTFTPMLVGFIAVGTNCLLNYLLIFEHPMLRLPGWGVKGAAAATAVSRVTECLILTCYVYSKKKKFPYIKGAFKSLYIPGAALGTMLRKGMPILFNEILWSSGMTAMSVAYSLHGLDVVAGYSISPTVSNLFSMAFLSLGSSIGIIAGKRLGAGDGESAYDAARKMTVFSPTVSLAVGALMFFFGGEVTRFYNTSPESIELAKFFIRACSFALPLWSVSNASYFTLRSGGKTVITSLFDSGFVWLVSVPAAFGLYYICHLPIHWIYPIVLCLELIKDVVGVVLVRKRVWIRTLV